MPVQKLSEQELNKLKDDIYLEELSHEDFEELIRNEQDLNKFLPDKRWSVDPRDGTRVLYSSVRAKRPVQVDSNTNTSDEDKKCPICSGKTTKIIDSAELTRGFTFINKNLFPVLYPFEGEDNDTIPKGMHFLQWTSNYHEEDWATMPVQDGVTVLQRTALLEKKLLEGRQHEQEYIIYIKNCGKMVGSSLPHDHQQLLYSTIPPARYSQHKRFYAEEGKYFSEFLLENTNEDLIVKEFGSGTLVVPYFMKRPYELSYILTNTDKRYIHELTNNELEDLALVMKEVIGSYKRIMPSMGLTIAYNIIFYIDSDTGLYLDFLPFTQHQGGLEKLGLYVCQGDPKHAANDLKQSLQM